MLSHRQRILDAESYDEYIPAEFRFLSITNPKFLGVFLIKVLGISALKQWAESDWARIRNYEPFTVIPKPWIWLV